MQEIQISMPEVQGKSKEGLISNRVYSLRNAMKTFFLTSIEKNFIEIN